MPIPGIRPRSIRDDLAAIYRTIDAAKSAIGSFINVVYNTQRLHSALNYQTLVVFEASQLGRSPPTVSNFASQAWGAVHTRADRMPHLYFDKKCLSIAYSTQIFADPK